MCVQIPWWKLHSSSLWTPDHQCAAGPSSGLCWASPRSVQPVLRNKHRLSDLMQNFSNCVADLYMVSLILCRGDWSLAAKECLFLWFCLIIVTDDSARAALTLCLKKFCQGLLLFNLEWKWTKTYKKPSLCSHRVLFYILRKEYRTKIGETAPVETLLT